MARWVIGNWKMNLTLGEAEVLAQSVVHTTEELPGLQVMIAPSLPFLIPLKEKLRFTPKNFYLAGQVISPWEKGAYTGDVAAFQLKGVVSHTLIGHSERRRFHHETGSIADQIRQALTHDITPVVCFGEAKRSAQVSSQILTDLGRDLSGLTHEQIQRCLFAYEPVWAISSQAHAEAATPAYVQKVVSRVEEWFGQKFSVRPVILYGGSVTDDNAQELAKVRQIGGVLVGGASLHAESFKKICRAFHGTL